MKEAFKKVFKPIVKLLGASEFTNSIMISMAVIWICWHYKILP